MTTIYYIRDDSQHDYNKDLFVEATSPDEAIALWRSYYECEDDDWPEKVYRVPTVSGAAKILTWHDKSGGTTIAWPPHLC